jgi:hypothetical protein
MDIGIMGIIVTISILVIETELSYKRINDYKNESSEVIVYLVEKNNSDENKKKADEIKKRTGTIDKYIKFTYLIKQGLPILLTIEAIHVTLQELQLTWYERIMPGLNGAFLIGMLLLVLLFFIIKEIKLSDNRILKSRREYMPILLKYKFNLNVLNV